jgi:hypothetical protein
MGDSASVDMATNIRWTEKLEDYFVATGEKAHCLSWIHKRAEELYSVRRTFIDLPVIVGSGVIAFLNAGSQSMFEDARLASISLGVGSLVVGILNTLGTYFGWSKRAEGHRISAIDYAKLYRFIAIEMALPREERMSPKDLLKKVKDDYDRLAEISPLVPPSIIAKFKRQFKKETSISKPEEANGLHKIEVFKPSDGDDMPTVTPKPKVGDSPVIIPMINNPLFNKALNPMKSFIEPKKPEDNFVPTVKQIEEIDLNGNKLPEVPKDLSPSS